MFSEIRKNSYLSPVLHQWSVNLAFGHQNKISEYNRNVLLLLRIFLVRIQKRKNMCVNGEMGIFFMWFHELWSRKSNFYQYLAFEPDCQRFTALPGVVQSNTCRFLSRKIAYQTIQTSDLCRIVSILSNVGLHVIMFLLYIFHYFNVRAKRGYFIVWNPSK